MKLIPGQVHMLQQELINIKKQLRSYNDYFSDIQAISGDRNYTIDNGNDSVTASQHHHLEKQQKEYKELLKYADRVLTIDTEKIELGTKFYIQFDGEEEKELFTLVEKALGLNLEHISTDSDIGKVLCHLKEKDRFETQLANGTKVSGTVTDIITNPKEYVRYITSVPEENRKSCLATYPKNLTLTDSQFELLQLEQNLLREKLSKEEQEKEGLHVGTKVTLKIGANQPRIYTIVDKEEKDIDSECEISIDNSLIDRMYHRKQDGRFWIYVGSPKKSSAKRLGKVLEINQENVFSEEEKNKEIHRLKTRIGYIDKLLTTSIRSHPEENANEIGIGSKVRLTVENGDEIEEKEVEIIQIAVSYELDSEYIEASSPIGEILLGKSAGSEIECPSSSEPYKVTINEITNGTTTFKGLKK